MTSNEENINNTTDTNEPTPADDDTKRLIEELESKMAALLIEKEQLSRIVLSSNFNSGNSDTTTDQFNFNNNEIEFQSQPQDTTFYNNLLELKEEQLRNLSAILQMHQSELSSSQGDDQNQLLRSPPSDSGFWPQGFSL